jgi:WD40 repeat protein
LETGSQVGFVPAKGREHCALFQPSGSLLTLTSQDGLLRWPIAYAVKTGGNPIAGPPERLALPFGNGLAQSGDGRIIVSCDRKVIATQRNAGGWILHTDWPGEPIHVDVGGDIRCIMISLDGRWVFTSHHVNGALNVFDSRDGALVKSIPHGGNYFDLWTTAASCFSPDGRWMGIALDGGRLMELGSWEIGPQLPGMVQYAPAGNFFAVATNAGIRLFDQTTGRELATLEDPSLDFAQQILFTSDASKIISINRNSGIRVWDLRLIRRQLKTMGLDWQASDGI